MAGHRHFRGQRSTTGHAAGVPALAALSLAAVLGLVASARAEALPLEREVSLGRPAVGVRIAVATEGDDTRITVRTGGHTAEARVGAALEDAEVERVALAGGTAAAVLRGRGAGGPIAALVVVQRGRATIPWVGRLAMRGDPGERTADVIEVADRTGDGLADVIVGQAREGVALCGEGPLLLHPRALDAASGALRPVVLRRVPEAADEVAIAASATSPGPDGGAVVRSLGAVGASSALGAGEDARGLSPPRAVVDGDPATYWAEGRGGAGEGELVVLRFGAQMPIRALAITAPAAEGVSAPRTLVLVGDRGPRLRVSWPAGLAGRAWIVPPAPLEWSCFAVLLADPGGAAAARVGIAEIEAFTELDFPAEGGRSGIEALVAELVREGEGGDRATLFLSRLGASAIGALDAAWERLGARGRERAVRVAAGPARTGDEGALALLRRAAGDESDAVRAAARGALGASGAAGRAALLAVAAGAGRGAEGAAAHLAADGEALDVGPLLEAAAREGGSERPELRAAIAGGAAAGGADAQEGLRSWASEAPIAARAAVAHALASAPPTRDLARELVAGAIGEASEFVDRFRLTRAAAELDEPGAEIDAWLAAVSRDADEWMLRAAAIEALGERAPEVARAALDDAYPRVRMAAIARSRGAGDAARLDAMARQDRWPMVRVAALDALADRREARGLLRAAIDDDAQMVRRRAIEHLTRLGDAEAWQAIEARLRDGDEWPIVVEAALGYVAQRCVGAAGDALIAVVRRGARQGAWEPDVELAVHALRVATRLGGAAAEDARRVAARGGEVLQAAVEASRADAQRCGPAP